MELETLIERHARPDMRTRIPGLFLSRVTGSDHEFSMTDPLLVVMARGGKRLLLGDRMYEYRAGECLIVTTGVPVSGHFFDTPALGLGLTLRPETITPLLLSAPPARPSAARSALATGPAGPALLDAVTRLVRLLDEPRDVEVLAPLYEREILWRVLTGPHGESLRQIALADSNLSHVNRAIGWLRANYAEPMRVDDLARRAGMSASAFHRHFRDVTAMSPLQFQKRLRLQAARSLLLARPDDVAGVGHLVGYDSPSQFSREYRRLFGAPPGADAARLRSAAGPLEPSLP
ncbi:AraC family transcriptional regulator [Actinoplanes sp. NPDC089786]|uniref:AraC family transcriptional regulator n=1 Tax=Actinoplanes sp. NPDC089786 TaxID=3155185 RepID=UPI0034490456